MTIFCITGFSKASTELTERVLLASGMSAHLPLERDPALNLVRWHDRATSAQPMKPTDSEAFDIERQPSRLWQQLAIDLMVANMDSAHWGWAHAGAVQWLEFWSQLEPEIRFVLVCEDRQSFVCRMVEEGQTPENISGQLELWAINHQKMLRFHLRNSARSILVWEAEVRTQPSNLLLSVAENWQTHLDAPRDMSEAPKEPTALLQHIAVEVLSEHPQTAALDHELQSLIGPAPCPSTSGRIGTADLIDLYGQMQLRTDLQSQLLLAQQSIEGAHVLRDQLQVQFQTTLELEREQWRKQLVLVQDEVGAETTAKQDALNKLAAEQSASAAVRKQKDELGAAQQDTLSKNKDLQEESDLLLAQLHLVQEELEKYYLQHKDRQIEVQALQDRWLRAVQSHPVLLEFEDLQILSHSKTELTAHWRINQLQVNGVMKGPFEFQTLIENGVTGLVFSKDAKGHSPILRWPLIADKDTQLAIIPVKGQDDPKKRFATIVQLGTSDWHLVQLLTDKLIKALDSTALAKQIDHSQSLLQGLKAHKQILEKIPALLRFDAIKLFGQQNTDAKSVIGLRLNGADLQGLRAEPFEFQLQLNLAGGSAVTSAHLIFEEQSAGRPFENWKQNVKSSSGQAVMALQLGPQGWNPQNWHALSPLDQQWLQQTVRLLPLMLSTLRNQGVRLEKGWTVWSKALDDLVNWSKLTIELPKPQSVVTDVVPSKLQPPDVAPVAPKVPRKLRKVVATPTKPFVKAVAVAMEPQNKKSTKPKPAKSASTDKAAAASVLRQPVPTKLISAKSEEIAKVAAPVLKQPVSAITTSAKSAVMVKPSPKARRRTS